MARFEPKTAAAAWTFRHHRTLFFLRHRTEYSARVGDDDSISVADIYDDYRNFSAQGKR